MITIRTGREADREAILGLTPRLGDFPVPPGRTAEEIGRADQHLILEALRQPAPECWLGVAELDQRVVGFVLVWEREDYFTHEALAHVEDLAIDTGAEGRGVARSLMEAAEAWASGRGYRRITLNVWAQNLRAIGLYQHLGYAPETVHYRKDLAPAPRGG